MRFQLCGNSLGVVPQNSDLNPTVGMNWNGNFDRATSPNTPDLTNAHVRMVSNSFIRVPTSLLLAIIKHIQVQYSGVHLLLAI